MSMDWVEDREAQQFWKNVKRLRDDESITKEELPAKIRDVAANNPQLFVKMVDDMINVYERKKTGSLSRRRLRDDDNDNRFVTKEIVRITQGGDREFFGIGADLTFEAPEDEIKIERYGENSDDTTAVEYIDDDRSQCRSIISFDPEIEAVEVAHYDMVELEDDASQISELSHASQVTKMIQKLRERISKNNGLATGFAIDPDNIRRVRESDRATLDLWKTATSLSSSREVDDKKERETMDQPSKLVKSRLRHVDKAPGPDQLDNLDKSLGDYGKKINISPSPKGRRGIFSRLFQQKKRNTPQQRRGKNSKPPSTAFKSTPENVGKKQPPMERKQPNKTTKPRTAPPKMQVSPKSEETRDVDSSDGLNHVKVAPHSVCCNNPTHEVVIDNLISDARVLAQKTKDTLQGGKYMLSDVKNSVAAANVTPEQTEKEESENRICPINIFDLDEAMLEDIEKEENKVKDKLRHRAQHRDDPLKDKFVGSSPNSQSPKHNGCLKGSPRHSLRRPVSMPKSQMRAPSRPPVNIRRPRLKSPDTSKSDLASSDKSRTWSEKTANPTVSSFSPTRSSAPEECDTQSLNNFGVAKLRISDLRHPISSRCTKSKMALGCKQQRSTFDEDVSSAQSLRIEGNKTEIFVTSSLANQSIQPRRPSEEEPYQKCRISSEDDDFLELDTDDDAISEGGDYFFIPIGKTDKTTDIANATNGKEPLSCKSPQSLPTDYTDPFEPFSEAPTRDSPRLRNGYGWFEKYFVQPTERKDDITSIDRSYSNNGKSRDDSYGSYSSNSDDWSVDYPGSSLMNAFGAALGL